MRIVALFILLVAFGCSSDLGTNLTFKKLLVEYSGEPSSIDMPDPRFSWIITSEGRDRYQSAFRILVSSSAEELAVNNADMWDSGQRLSSGTIHHKYEGKKLLSNKKYYWKVIILDERGKKHESQVSTFETAFLKHDSWNATWIGAGPGQEQLPPEGFYAFPETHYGFKDTIRHSGRSLLLRREAEIRGKIRSAKIFISGLGFYELFINGKRVGNQVLSPAKTPYHKYVLYDTYDITDLMVEGTNAFGIHLGNGWYNPYKKWWRQYRMQWFGSKRAIAVVIVTFEDGSSVEIATGKDWKYSEGAVTFNCIYDGEIRNSNLEKSGWTTAGYDDSAWKQVTLYNDMKARLASQRMPGVKVNALFRPVAVGDTAGAIKVFDMGQNFAGWVRIKAAGEKNTVIRIRFAEDIHEDGTLDVTSNENAGAEAYYIMSGEGIEAYEPSFSWFGFRYVELSGSGTPFRLIDIEGRALWSSNEAAGAFNCDNDLVNKIHSAAVWSQKSNMIGYPMDCPQRDERLGWLGDAQVSAEQAMYNFDMALFYQNWLEGIMENQDEKSGDIPVISPQPYMPDEGVEWSSTYIILLWQFYVNYSDTAILEKHYPSMKRYMEFLASKAEGDIIPKGWIGDWGSLVKGWREGEPESVPTAFYLYNSGIMSKIATVLNLNEDKEYYAGLYESIRNSYNNKYLNRETGNYLKGTQMDNAFPLFLGIVPDDLREKVLQNLVDGIVKNNDTHLTTGVLGTKYMPEALATEGRADLAWQLINRKTYPSWHEMVNRYTTTCEFWTLKQSKNHVMMGSIDAWFYKYLAGIKNDENNPGWAYFTIKPFIPEGLASAEARIETIRGTIYSGWENDNNRLDLTVEVPFNSSALVSIPAAEEDQVKEGRSRVSGKSFSGYMGYSEGYHNIKVQSGKYHFRVIKDTK